MRYDNIARTEKDGRSKGKQMMVIRKDRVVEKKIEAKESRRMKSTRVQRSG